MADRKLDVERWAARRRDRAALALAFGEFIATLAAWSWFVNPISFRDDRPGGGPPVRDAALAGIQEWLADIERMAGAPIGWVLAEEFGRVGGRWHCHALISDVADLSRKFWWSEAHRRFGRTRIEPFDPDRGAAFYAAKYAAKALGALHFGGTLRGKNLDCLTQGPQDLPPFGLASAPQPQRIGKEIVYSAEIEKPFFRLGLKRWHR